MFIDFDVLGAPRGKNRPRFGNGRTYTDKETTLAENEIRAAWREAGALRVPDGLAISMEIWLYTERPAGHFKKDGSLSAEGARHLCPRRKPDVDNAAKLVMDALNGLAYRDDVDIVHLHVWRAWSTPAATRIVIQPVQNVRG